MPDTDLSTVEGRYALVRRAFDVKSDIELRYLEMGAILKEIRDTGAWKDTYTSFDNPRFHNFIEDLGVKKSTANKLIQIYEKLVLEYQVPSTKLLEAGGWSKLAEILPVISDSESANRYVDLAIASRNQKDLRDNLREERTGVIMTECPHNDYYVLKICRHCGDRVVVLTSDDVSESGLDGGHHGDHSSSTHEPDGDDTGEDHTIPVPVQYTEQRNVFASQLRDGGDV